MIAFVAAVWFAISFVTPSTDGPPLHHYEARRCNAVAGCQPANLYHSPSALSPVVPKAAGLKDTVFVSVTSDPHNAYGVLNGGAAYQLRAVDVDGNVAPWSNILVGATACADTNYSDAGRRWIRPPGGVARFTRAPGDTEIVVGPLMTQRQFTLLVRDALCSIYGYVGDAGVRVPCYAP